MPKSRNAEDADEHDSKGMILVRGQANAEKLNKRW